MAVMGWPEMERGGGGGVVGKRKRMASMSDGR
jgi:hypothetical protein